jgi:predicted phage replisome organizer
MNMEVKWIKIDTDIFNDEKIAIIEGLPDADADSIIIIWFKLLCLAGRQNNNGVFVLNNEMPFTDEMFAAIFRRPVQSVRKALSIFENLGMIEIYDDVVTIPNWEKHQNLDQMEKIKEQTKERVKKYREKQKQLLRYSNVTVTLQPRNGNAIEEDKDKDKELDIIIGAEDELLDQNNNQKEKQNNNINNSGDGYGTFKNVFLTDDELAELKTACPLWEQYIERLSEYMVNAKKDYTYNGKPYHYKKIMDFYNDDKKKGKVPVEENKPSYDSESWADRARRKTPHYERKSE